MIEYGERNLTEVGIELFLKFYNGLLIQFVCATYSSEGKGTCIIPFMDSNWFIFSNDKIGNPRQQLTRVFASPLNQIDFDIATYGISRGTCMFLCVGKWK